MILYARRMSEWNVFRSRDTRTMSNKTYYVVRVRELDTSTFYDRLQTNTELLANSWRILANLLKRLANHYF